MAEDTPPTRNGGTGLQSKLFGLPTWGWLAIAAAAGIGVTVWLQYRRSGKDTTDTTQTSDVPAESGSAGGVDIGEFETLAAQVRDLQGKLSTPATTPSTGGVSTDPVPKPDPRTVINNPAAVLPAPSALHLVVGASSSTATWAPNGGAKSYQWLWTDKYGSYTGTTTSILSVHKSAKKLSKGDKVYFRVAGITPDGVAGHSSAVNGTVK